MAEELSQEPGLVQQLSDAARELEALCLEWQELPVNSVALARLPQLRAREASARASASDCEFGDPADTRVVPQHTSSHPLVAAHTAVTKAILETQLAKMEWHVRCAEAAGHDRPGSPEVGKFLRLLVDIAELRLRLLDVRGAYDALQRTADMGLDFRVDERLSSMALSIVMCQALREPGAMAGVDVSPGSRGEALLRGLRETLLAQGYTVEGLLRATRAASMIDLGNEDLAELHEAELDRLADEEGTVVAELEEAAAPEGLADLIRAFMLHRPLPLPRLCQLLGPEHCRLLLRLQALTAFAWRGYKLVPVDEAVGKASCDELLCVSNIKIWPLDDDDLLIATDEQTWPCEGFEPVMYLSDDSFALARAAPRVEARSVLDVCCGSGVQGIVALRHYAASATFVDLNPRALDFARFNVALNGLGHKAAGFHCGDLFAALPPAAGPFDAVLANPPFLPNPQGIASQAVALFGNGGELGEQVLAAVVRGAPVLLAPGGRLAAVTYAPNAEEMPARLEAWLRDAHADGLESCLVTVFSGTAKPATEFLPVASEVESRCYQEALRKLDVRTLSEAITVLTLTGAESEGPKARLIGPQEGLFDDEAFLQGLAQLHGIET